MGLAYGINNDVGQITRNESFKILEKAYLSGITHLDTAELYGNAHTIIGDFHSSNPKNKFNVITKLPSNKNVLNIELKIDNYLNTLKTNQIDCLMYHSFDSFKSQPEVIKKLIVLKNKGLIKKIGVSLYTNQELEFIINTKDISLIQIPFNLFDNVNIRGKLLKKAVKHGKEIHTRSSFLQGLFFKNPEESNSIVSSLKEPLLAINNIANKEKVSIETLALAYCIQQNSINKVLIGVDSLDQLSSNIKACKYKISKETIAEINQININNSSLLNPSLWSKIK